LDQAVAMAYVLAGTPMADGKLYNSKEGGATNTYDRLARLVSAVLRAPGAKAQIARGN